MIGWLALLLGAASRTRVAAGFALLLAVLFARTVSLAASSQAETWWTTQQENSIAVARVVNRSEKPLLVSDAYLIYPLVFANYLRPDVAIVLRPLCYECADPSPPQWDPSMFPQGSFTNVYALGPSAVLNRLAAAYAASHGNVRYECIDIHSNCLSSLNVWPVYRAAPARRDSAR